MILLLVIWGSLEDRSVVDALKNYIRNVLAN